MRLDHFVLFNNHLTTTKGTHMADNTLTTSLTNNGANMSNNALTTPSITRSMGFKPSESVWIETMSNNLVGTGKRIYGRIQDTGCNYVIEGWNMNGEWVRIPCRRLQDAQMLLAKVMRKSTFDVLRNGQ